MLYIATLIIIPTVKMNELLFRAKSVPNAVPSGIYSSDSPQFWHHHACYKYNFRCIQVGKNRSNTVTIPGNSLNINIHFFIPSTTILIFSLNFFYSLYHNFFNIFPQFSYFPSSSRNSPFRKRSVSFF